MANRWALLLAALAWPAFASRYVPSRGWEDKEDALLHERWFGGQLAAMGEPVLASSRDLDGFIRRFRLTALPSFRPGLAIRVDQRTDGGANLHWVVLDGAGGHALGKVAKHGDRPLSREEVARLASMIERAKLDEKPQEEKAVETGHSVTGDRGLRICGDGTAWIFEDLQPTNRDFVERNFCYADDPDLKRLIADVYLLAPADLIKEPAFYYPQGVRP